MRRHSASCIAGTFEDSDPEPVTVEYQNLPVPNETGVFTVGSDRIVVIPIAESEDFGQSSVLCAGEQLLANIGDRIGSAPPGIEWDQQFLEKFLPLSRLIHDFLETHGQQLDDTNWYSRVTHLRRILNPGWQHMLPDSQKGLVCPIDTPEEAERADKLYSVSAERTGKVLTVARGGTIKKGKFEIISDDPADHLGPVTATLPFVEYGEPVRSQIAVNLLRQWRKTPVTERAAVKTGLEPDDPGFWIGSNMLTAYALFGKHTYEDSIVISRSVAEKFGLSPVECIGTKLSNRSGQKGVIGAVVPDEEMPRLEDGTPVQLVVSFLGLHARMNCGQLYEAMASWISRESGGPYIAPPFDASVVEELERKLRHEPYLQHLSYKAQDIVTRDRCFVDWVYWGVCTPGASNRLRLWNTEDVSSCTRQGEMESNVLIQRGALHMLRERLTDLAAEKTCDGPYSVPYDNLESKLRAAGIAIHIDGDALHIEWSQPKGDTINLAVPLPHPWMPGRMIDRVGVLHEIQGWRDLVKINNSLASSKAMPGILRDTHQERLPAALRAYFGNLFGPLDGRLGARLRRSARGMIASGADLAYYQIGIPERMAAVLFSPGEAPE